ncbi:MAG: hypothetical protein EBS53_19250 [Bacteroidetes bacterium]|nr:hypothetical protein [Bacteroidota bacterium]
MVSPYGVKPGGATPQLGVAQSGVVSCMVHENSQPSENRVMLSKTYRYWQEVADGSAQKKSPANSEELRRVINLIQA